MFYTQNHHPHWILTSLTGKIIEVSLRWWNTQGRDNLSLSKAVMYILNLGRYVNPCNLPCVRLADKSKLPETSGIYFAIASKEIFYIGRAQNIKQRWKQHHRELQLLHLIDLKLHWLKCTTNSLVLVEKECIEKFRPSLNLQPVSKEPPTRKKVYRWHLTKGTPCHVCGSTTRENIPVWRNKERRYKIICCCCSHWFEDKEL